jgi:hypothetical protein
VLTLDNITTTDAYTEDSTLGPVPTAESIAIVVANASVFAQIAATDAAGTIQGWGPELLLTPQSTVLTRAQGVRFRSAQPGGAAQVVAQLFEPRDPLLSGGNAFTSILSPSGGVSPAPGAPQVTKGARVIATAAQTFGNAGGAPAGARAFGAEQFDNDNIWVVGSPTRLTCRTEGVYLIESTIVWVPNANGVRAMVLLKNGGSQAVERRGANPTAGEWSVCSLSTILSLTIGDYLEVAPYQTSAGALDSAISDGGLGGYTYFGMAMIGTLT